MVQNSEAWDSRTSLQCICITNSSFWEAACQVDASPEANSKRHWLVRFSTAPQCEATSSKKEDMRSQPRCQRATSKWQTAMLKKLSNPWRTRSGNPTFFLRNLAASQRDSASFCTSLLSSLNYKRQMQDWWSPYSSPYKSRRERRCLSCLG